MEFKSGMLGCCVIMVILAASVFGTILISADADTHDVTKYRFETEVTGLFPVDSSPEFMDYDLSRNYTGYYTLNTVVRGVNYWGGATFTETGVNNYPVKYVPGDSTSEDATIDSTLNSSLDNMNNYTPRYTVVTYYNKPYGEYFSFSTQAYTKTINSLIRELNLSTYDIIEIKTERNNVNADDHNFWTYFGTSDQFYIYNGSVKGVNYVVYNQYQTYPTQSNYYISCDSVKIDTVNNMVSFYSNGVYVFQASTNDTVISYSTLGVDGNTGIPITINAYDVGIIEYMDISQGVTIIGV